MARGDKKIYEQQQQQQLAQDNQIAQQAAKNQQSVWSQVTPMYEQEYAAPGYSDSEKQAIRQATAGSLAGAFGAARTRLQNHAAATGNSAGVNATEEELAREQGRENSQAMGGLEQQFGQARIAGQQDAMHGLSNLYGETSQPLSIGVGGANSLVGDQARLAGQPGFWSQVAQRGLGALEDVGAGYLGGVVRGSGK